MRLFFDRDVGRAVPEALLRVGVDVTYHHLVYGTNQTVPDVQWIQDATADHRICVTRDKKILSRKHEVATFVGAGARVLVLRGQGGRFHMLRALLQAWQSASDTAESEPGPWAYSIDSRGTFRQLYPRS